MRLNDVSVILRELKWSESHSVVSDSLRPHGPHSPWNSPGQNTGMGSLSLLQGIFPTQGSNPGLLHCRQILYQLNHKGSPKVLGWVAYPFSRRSSPPRNQTGVSCIAGRFFTSWAMCQSWALNSSLPTLKPRPIPPHPATFAHIHPLWTLCVLIKKRANGIKLLEVRTLLTGFCTRELNTLSSP